MNNIHTTIVDAVELAKAGHDKVAVDMLRCCQWAVLDGGEVAEEVRVRLHNVVRTTWLSFREDGAAGYFAESHLAREINLLGEAALAA